MGEEKGKLRERKSSEKRGGRRRKESYGQGEGEIESWGKRELNKKLRKKESERSGGGAETSVTRDSQSPSLPITLPEKAL